MTTAAEAGFGCWLGEGLGEGLVEGPRGEADWLASLRAAARERVTSLGVPTTKTESWRYTGLKRLLEEGFRPVVASAGRRSLPALEELLVPGLVSYRAVLVDGRFEPGLSELGGLPAGVRISGLRQALGADPDALREHLVGLAEAELPLFAALNTAAFEDGLAVLLEPGVRLGRPIELIHLAQGGAVPSVVQPRLVLSLGEGAHATLIERYLGLADDTDCTKYCVNAMVQAALGRDAVLVHQRVQSEAPRAFHLSTVQVSQGHGSRYQGLNLALGGAWARTEIRARFAGERAECDLAGLYLAGDGQLSDVHLDVDHRLPHCTSRENFKGILCGKGRAVFDGRVVVAPDAQGSDAAMNNRNLLLSEGAEVDTKPQLEINADDVKCSHGTTVGQIDPEQLFYLRSRGLGAPLARRLVCLGFAGEVLDALTPEPLRAQVAEDVGRRLERAPLD